MKKKMKIDMKKLKTTIKRNKHKRNKPFSGVHKKRVVVCGECKTQFVTIKARAYCDDVCKKKAFNTIQEKITYYPPGFSSGQTIKTKKSRKKVKGIKGADFLKSREWRSLRYTVLKKYGSTCMCCGAKRSDGVRMHVDHIKPRSRYPELSLKFSNLQVLCEDCNVGKSNKHEDDFRNLT